MDKEQEVVMDSGVEQPKKTRKSHKKLLILIAAIFVVVGLAIAAIVVITIWNAPSSRLLSSIQNTANQKMLQLSVDAKLQQDKADASAITISNAKYKNGEGLSADATSRFTNEYGDLTTKTQWVITAKGTIYAGLVSTGLKTSDAGKKLMAQYNMPDGAIVAMLNRDAGTWSKMDTSANTGTSYGFDPCALQVAYMTLAKTTETGEFLKKVVTSHNFQVTHKDNSYVVTLKGDARGAVNDLYKSSAVYASLKKCVDNSDSDLVQGGLGDLLTDAQLQFDVDNSNLIQKITYTSSGMSVTATVSVAKDVSIKTPTVTPVEPLKAGETAEEYLKRTRPFVYNHLQEIGEISKGQ